jgi:hypothetical protein
MSKGWESAGNWLGEDLRREAFFFESGGTQLFGSLYAARERSRADAIVVCNSWGFEANQADRSMHQIALRMARAGGAGLIFHYPGYGDSHGEAASVEMSALVEATVGLVAEGSERLPEARWSLVGLMFGCGVAALASRRTTIERLLLVQPALPLAPYLTRLQRSAERGARRVPETAGTAYGYPVPDKIAANAAALDLAVDAALRAFGGAGAVVRHDKPAPPWRLPDRYADIVVPGTWRFGARQKQHLADAGAQWLDTVPLPEPAPATGQQP